MTLRHLRLDSARVWNRFRYRRGKKATVPQHRFCARRAFHKTPLRQDHARVYARDLEDLASARLYPYENARARPVPSGRAETIDAPEFPPLVPKMSQTEPRRTWAIGVTVPVRAGAGRKIARLAEDPDARDEDIAGHPDGVRRYTLQEAVLRTTRQPWRMRLPTINPVMATHMMRNDRPGFVRRCRDSRSAAEYRRKQHDSRPSGKSCSR